MNDENPGSLRSIRASLIDMIAPELEIVVDDLIAEAKRVAFAEAADLAQERKHAAVTADYDNTPDDTLSWTRGRQFAAQDLEDRLRARASAPMAPTVELTHAEQQALGAAHAAATHPNRQPFADALSAIVAASREEGWRAGIAEAVREADYCTNSEDRFVRDSMRELRDRIRDLAARRVKS